VLDDGGHAEPEAPVLAQERVRLPIHVNRVTAQVMIGRGTTRAEDAQGTPTQSHISPSILVYEENGGHNFKGFTAFCLKNGSSQGHTLAWTVVCVPNSLDSGEFGTLTIKHFDHQRLSRSAGCSSPCGTRGSCPLFFFITLKPRVDSYRSL